ncbi:MAG: VanZ family protein [Candidatus Brocadiaceae bacterium]|uniref:VanZ family protein n=1 Tax=Candidatus Wunengus sp. YC61 TaxID=3367698 RepID=UPI002724E63A|nr:VanZ family protein [Candidatus Brocadiaceae bacterium]
MRVNIKIPWLIKCILTLAYAYLIFAASSKDTSSIAIPRYVDKLIHFVEFGFLCLMTCWSLSSAQVGSKEIYKIILAIGITSLYGISDEFHQSFTPHRSVDVLDWLADTAGAVAAGFLWQMSVYKLQTNEKSLAMDKTPINM